MLHRCSALPLQYFSPALKRCKPWKKFKSGDALAKTPSERRLLTRDELESLPGSQQTSPLPAGFSGSAPLGLARAESHGGLAVCCNAQHHPAVLSQNAFVLFHRDGYLLVLRSVQSFAEQPTAPGTPGLAIKPINQHSGVEMKCRCLYLCFKKE